MKKDLNYYKQNAEEDYLTTPISVLRYIGKVEQKNDNLGIIISVLLIVCFLVFCGGIYVGQDVKQAEIENRAKEIKTETITQQDLELIIFNEIQL